MRIKQSMTICFGMAFVFLIIAAGTVAAETNNTTSIGGGGVGEYNDTDFNQTNGLTCVEGPVYNGFSLNEIIGSQDSDFVEMNASNFAGFFIGESLRIYGGNFVSGRIINEDGLVYKTQIEQTGYESIVWDSETYSTMGFFGNEYVALDDYDAGELFTLLVDSGNNHTLGVGGMLDLGNGYSLTLLQIDVSGEKVWLEFTKDGIRIDYEVIDISAGPVTWILDLNIGSQNDVEVLRVHVADISQTESSVLIDGLWLVDFQNVFEIETADEFGVLEVDSVSNSLSMMNYDPMFLVPGSLQEIAEGMKFKVNSSTNYLEFYLTTESVETKTINSSIDIEKSTNGNDADSAPGPEIDVGDLVRWEYVITNNGNVDLYNVTITDDKLGYISGPSNLPVGMSITLVVDSAAEVGQHTNVGIVTAEYEGRPISDSDSSNYFGIGDTYIPEFPTIALPVVAIIGLAIFFQRRKE